MASMREQRRFPGITEDVAVNAGSIQVSVLWIRPERSMRLCRGVRSNAPTPMMEACNYLRLKR